MITITNKNIYRSEFSLSSLYSLEKVEILPIDEIVNFLSDSVELGESVTFKRLFEIVSANLIKFNDIFYSSLGGYALEPYLQEIENNPTEINEFDHLEIHWFCDKYDDELNICPSLHGVSIKEEITYALDFTSLNNLKNFVVKINESVELYDYKMIKENKDDVLDIKDTLIELGNKAFTLFELFNSIFYEISFHGGPQDKKERESEIMGSIDEVKDNLEEYDPEKFTTFEDMMEKFDAKDKYLVKYEELRDRVEKKRMSNKKNLPKLKSCLLEKLKIYDIIEKSETDDDLQQYYKKLTDIEFNMQLLYGEEEDISSHRFWETPKCTCPKIDNLELYPSGNPLFDKNCPIHKK
jgi:hypothetical protein